MRGPSKALTLFGPRRSGKTTFLLRDLGPLAEARGHRVVYVSFWSTPLAPLAVLLHALETSRRKASLADRTRAFVTSLTPRLKLSGPFPGTVLEASVDLTELGGKPRPDLLLHLDDLLGRIADPRRPALLLLDEVQELAQSRDNAGLVSALRTALDKRHAGIAAVFTGSSRDGLDQMFSARTAPFFHYAMPFELPPLGADFVDHMLRAFHAVAKRRIARAEAVDAFAALSANPEYFRRLLDLLLRDAATTIPLALAELRAHLAADQGFITTWLSLAPLQRAVARVLAKGTVDAAGPEALAEIARMTGTPPPQRAAVLKALDRLRTLRIAGHWSGRWSIDDPALAAWIRARRR